MNIGCDGRALVGPRTGVGTWTERVVCGLARAGVGTVYLAASRAVILEPGELHPAVVRVPPPTVPMLGPVWLNGVVPGTARRLGLDVWIGALAILPVRCPVPAVSMVHDLTPRTHPSRHTWRNRLVHRFFLERSVREARSVVAGSAATAAAVVTAFPWLESKIETIGYGVDEWYSPPPPGDDGTAIRRRFSCGRPYLLHLGTLEPRKGIPDLVAAWELMVGDRDDAPDLVIAGREGWQTEAILDRVRSSPGSDRIHLPGYVGREDARALLRHAEAFVLASEAEGFGLPLAEAISCGTPAVASDIPALREAGGDAALYCPAHDVEALAVALASALEPATAGRLRERARARAPRLRWGPVVTAWAELLERVVSRD